MTIRLQVFTAKWAPPAPVLPLGYPHEAIDVDANPEAAERIGIKGLPCVVARGEMGAILGAFLGSAPTETVAEWVQGLEA